MRRALELAAQGPVTGGNPQVGCVLVDAAGAIVAEGWHRGAGTAHAEVDALCKLPTPDGAGCRGLTAVVTLEPCNHTGRTGPCSGRAASTPASRASSTRSPTRAQRPSGGAERLRAAGVEVLDGVLADEAEAFLHEWLTAVRRGRPWVTVKWASTLDGRAAAADGSSQWITGTAARQRVHEQREAERRDPGRHRHGARRRPVASPPAATRASCCRTSRAGGGRRARDSRRTRRCAGTRQASSRPAAATSPAILADLDARGIRRVYVEGGPTLASALIAAGLADEYSIYLAPALLGGDRLAIGDLGIPTIDDALRLRITAVEQLGDDLLLTARPATPARTEN